MIDVDFSESHKFAIAGLHCATLELVRDQSEPSPLELVRDQSEPSER